MISDPDMETISELFTRMDLQQNQTYNSLPPKEIIGNESQRIFVFSSQQCGFSNRFPSRFTLLGIEFSTMEKYFVWQKARYFADFEIAEHVLILNNPDQIYRFGLRIRGFRYDEWKNVQDKIMYIGLLAKFTQNAQLFSQLRGTGDCLIAEAATVNKYWTNGISISNLVRLKNPATWDGDNKLGILLMELRKEINSSIF